MRKTTSNQSSPAREMTNNPEKAVNFMSEESETQEFLGTHPVPIPVKLSLLWASLMSLYIYNDYLILFIPGQIDGMSVGSMGPLGEATDLKLLIVGIIMAIPASMIFLSSLSGANISRRLNMIVGPIYCLIAVATLFGSPPFYKLLVLIEIAATLLIVWIAARWPLHC